MKNWSKFIAIAVVLTFVLSLSSCRSSKCGCPGNNFSVETID